MIKIISKLEIGKLPQLDKEHLLKTYKEKKIKAMNSKMAINSQLSTTESKIQTKQTSRTKTESQIWRLFVGLSAGRKKGKKMQR